MTRRWRWCAGVLAAWMVLLATAAPALAGAPGDELPPPGQGGLLPGEGEVTPGEWQEYPPRPAGGNYPYGTGTQVWPPFLEDVFGFVGDAVNPGKWAQDTIMGGLSSLTRIIMGACAQVVYFLAGRETTNPYAPQQGGQGAARPTIQGVNVLTQTPVELTYGNTALFDEVGGPLQAAAMMLLSLFLLWTAVRHLVDSLTGKGSLVHGGGEQIRRVIVAVALTGGGFRWIIARLIDFNNILCRMALGGLEGQDILNVLQWDESADALLQVGLILETAGALVVFLLVMLALGGIMLLRIVTLNIMLLAGPLVAMTYAAEETAHYLMRWVSLAVGTVYYQFFAVLALRIAAWFLIDAWSNLIADHALLRMALATVAVSAGLIAPPILGFAMRGSGQAGRWGGQLAGQAAHAVGV